MNRAKNIMWKKIIIVVSFLMVLSIPGLLLAQDKPVQKAFSLNGPGFLTIPGTFDYSIRVFNSGEKIKEDTRVVLYLPKNINYIGATPKGSVSPLNSDVPTTITWQLGNMEPGNQIEITFTVQAEKRGRISIDAECSDSTQTSPIKVSSSATIVGVPNIKMSCYDTADPVAVGKNTTYVLEILNDGSSPGTNIKIEYQIPEQMKFVSAKVPPGLKYITKAKRVIFSTWPILTPGEKITCRIVCNVTNTGSAKSTATLTYDQSIEPMIDEESTSCYR